MSIFQPLLNDTIRIAIVKVELDSIIYETGSIAADKANYTFSICRTRPQYMANVLYEKPLGGLGCDWLDSLHTVTQVINIYLPAELDPVNFAS